DCPGGQTVARIPDRGRLYRFRKAFSGSPPTLRHAAGSIELLTTDQPRRSPIFLAPEPNHLGTASVPSHVSTRRGKTGGGHKDLRWRLDLRNRILNSPGGNGSSRPSGVVCSLCRAPPNGRGADHRAARRYVTADRAARKEATVTGRHPDRSGRHHQTTRTPLSTRGRRRRDPRAGGPGPDGRGRDRLQLSRRSRRQKALCLADVRLEHDRTSIRLKSAREQQFSRRIGVDRHHVESTSDSEQNGRFPFLVAPPPSAHLKRIAGGERAWHR